MPRAQPYLRIDGRTGLERGRVGWPTGVARHIVAAANGPLEMAALADGAVGLASPNGGLGGLTLPPWLSIDAEGRTLLLDRHGRLWFLGFTDKSFRRIAGLGGTGAVAIACTEHSLAIADPEARRVLVYDATSFGLRAVLDAHVIAPPFRPVALYADSGELLVLDAAGHRVLGLRDEQETPRLLLTLPRGTPAVDRVLRARDEAIVLKVRNAARVLIFAADGTALGETDQAAALRPLVPSPPLRLDNHGRFHPHGASGPAFDRDGRAVDVAPDEPAGLPPLVRAGSWTSRALDGRRDDVRWHRIAIRLSDFPPGTSMRVSTLTANESSIDGSDPATLDADAWDFAFAATAPLQPLSEGEGLLQQGYVQSPTGRHLWLRLDLSGTGHSTPVIGRIDVRYDGASAGDLLPAVFKEDRRGWRFLQRYLDLAEDELDRVTTGIDERGHIVDPRLATPEQLTLMAERLGIVLDDNWSTAAKRRLLFAARRQLTHRGTPAAVQAQLAAVLAAISGRDVESLQKFPRLLEGYAERRWMRLGTSSAGLQGAAPVWSQTMSGRVRLGDGAREGEARLAEPGDESTEDFREHAHRFRVFVPAAFLPDKAAVEAFERAIAREKPAHTQHELRRVRPGFVVGQQSTIGLDTILGDPHPLRLGDDDATAPGDARLGVDTTLAGETRPGVRLRPGLRLDPHGLRI